MTRKSEKSEMVRGRVFVGNLAMRTSQADLREAFQPFGDVTHIDTKVQTVI